MIIKLKNKDTLICDDFQFKCSIGKNGLKKNKLEGDNCTPTGIFSLGPVYYRNDRVDKPNTMLKTLKINKKMGWCDDVKNKKIYNKLIKVNSKVKHEKLYRADFKYDYLIPINYNSTRQLGKGSAIFIHLTKNYVPTAGCIALKKKRYANFIKINYKENKNQN